MFFFRACRHHSTKSAKWGAFDTVCPLICKWGQLPPLPSPGSAIYDDMYYKFPKCPSAHAKYFAGCWGGGEKSH